jgi:outer membrane receptor protein involved in Fe transport
VGVEANFEFRTVKNLTLSGSATYAKVRDIVKHLDSVNAPRLSASGTAEYKYELNDDLAVKLRAGFRHRSSKYNQLGEQEQDGEFTTVNFGARLESAKGWFANANVENAFNAKGANFGFPGPDPFIKSFKTLEPLRRIMLSVGTKF